MDDREQQRKVKRRLAMIRHAQEVTGNVAQTCRLGNVNSNWPHRAHLIRPHLGVPGREHAHVMSGGGAQ